MEQLVLDKVYLHPVRLEVIHDCMYDGIAHHCTKKPRRCVEWCANEDAPIQGVADKPGDIVVLVLVRNRILPSSKYLSPPGLLLSICQPTLQGIVGNEMPKQHQNQNELPSHAQLSQKPSSFNILQQVTRGEPSQFLSPQGQSVFVG